MQASTLVQALREDLEAACSHRDDLAGEQCRYYLLLSL